MKKNSTTFILIISIIVTIASVSLFVFFLKIIKNKNQHTSTTLITLQDKLQEKEDSIINASKISEIKLIQESMNNYFVDSDKIDVFVDYLEEIGSGFSSKVSVKSIEASQKTKDIISIKLSITGSFGAVMRTISFLENIPYQINITQIYFNKNEKQDRTKTSSLPAWQADVSFNILSLN
jgi:hypothetical protein